MAQRDTFTTDEWNLLRLVPAMVASGTSAAEPSGLFGSIKEAAAGAAGLGEAVKAHAALELFAAFGADRSIPGMPDPATLIGEGPREAQLEHLKNAVLERVRSAVDLVAQKATPAEAQAYRQLLVDVARKAAEASKEGGFLGFGGTRVSDKEKAFISQVAQAAGIAA
jgi:plasmid stabilization system protein ParE